MRNNDELVFEDEGFGCCIILFVVFGVGVYWDLYLNGGYIEKSYNKESFLKFRNYLVLFNRYNMNYIRFLWYLKIKKVKYFI